MKRSLFVLLISAGMLYAEDFSYISRSPSLTGVVTGYDNVVASGLTAGFAGAVGTINNNNEYSISGNVNVTLTGCSNTNKGGLFYLQQSSYTNPQLHTTLNITNNSGKVTLSDNYATGVGGAIAADNNSSYPEYYSITNISGNSGTVEFSGNNSDDDGGAIWSNGVLNINNNGSVSFTGNAVNKANGNWGGAIYMGVSTENSFNICGNDYVEFRGNYLYKPQSTYVPEATVRLNSIYQKGTNKANTISAKTGGSVVFYDAVITESAGSRASYELNAAYQDENGELQQAGGTITFSGKYTQSDLDSFAGAVGDVEASRTSTLAANTTLHNGTLNIEHNAVLQTKNLTIKSGAQLTLMDGTCKTLAEGEIRFDENSMLSITGGNTLAADTITFDENVSMSLTLGALNQETALIALSTSNLTFTLGSVDFLGMETLAEGKYLVLTLTDAQIGAMDWNTDELVISGLSEGDSFEWNESGTALYLNHTVVPEPTTATLSLLALAALAARRRRR